MLMMHRLLVIVVLVAAIASAAVLDERPSYIGCVNDAECEEDECCLLGASRFSIPECRLKPRTDETCRPGSNPLNTTVHYPNGDSVKLTRVWFVLCPCTGDMECNGGVCAGGPGNDIPRD